MPNVAVLIDAENVLPGFAGQVFRHAEEIGTLTAKEIYGTAAALTSWVEPVLRYAIHPNLTIKASKGKNSSDIALVIGAMDLLVSRQADTVIIASSDSDFSALSVRLRAAGLDVVGMGTEKANPLWRTACTTFVTLEAPTAAKPATQKQQPAAQKPQPAKQPETPPQPAAVPPAQAQPAAKPATTKVAPTHSERIPIIRARITELLRSNSGKMLVSTIFHSLNRLPEYRVDQQGSKRKPLNYLTWLFGDTFYFADSPNGMLISLTPITPAAKEDVKEASGEPGTETSDTAPETTPEPNTDEPAADTANVEEPGTDQAVPAAKDVPEPEASAQELALEDRPLTALSLPSRTINALKNAGLKTVGEVGRLTESELLDIKNIGPAASRQIMQAVQKLLS